MASIRRVLRLMYSSQLRSCTFVHMPLNGLPKRSTVLWDMWFFRKRFRKRDFSFPQFSWEQGCQDHSIFREGSTIHLCFRSFNLPKQQSIHLALLAAESLQCLEAAASSNKTLWMHLSRCVWCNASQSLQGAPCAEICGIVHTLHIWSFHY